MYKLIHFPVALTLAICLSGTAMAQTQEPTNEQLYRIIRDLQRQVEYLKSQVEAQQRQDQSTDQAAETRQLQRQVEQQQAQIEALADAQEADTGSSWVDRTSLGGYGELHYNNLDAEDPANDHKEIDFHRFVLFLGHEFTDDIRLFSELELEHSLAGESKPGEVELEQAYIEFDLFDDMAAARAGLFLLPVGILNETHEPPTFYGVERNDVESVIIPSTWWAGGAGYTHRWDSGFSFDLAVHEGLAIPTTGSSAGRVRSGRQKTAEATAEDLAATSRIKYTGIPGVEIAAAVQYQGDATQASSDGIESGLLYEAHLDLKQGPFGFRALYAGWDFDIDESILQTNGLTPAEIDRVEDQHGWYIEPSWRFIPELGAYVRYEDIEAARSRDNFTQWQVGINFWPHENVVLKADYRDREHDFTADEGRDFDGFDLGVGFYF